MQSEYEDSDEESFELARFPIEFHLPAPNDDLLADARTAIRREYRDSVRWKRLRCRNVSVLSETEKGTVFILEVGHSVEFDWTWEGAVAFRPLLLKEFAEDADSFVTSDDQDLDIDDSIIWKGEVLEVDEAKGRIYVCVTDPEHPPETGSFYVRPFEFLAFLESVFNDDCHETYQNLLPSRLLASEGGVHPEQTRCKQVGLDFLSQWWRKQWSILWGPPGTGKTYTTGQQVAKVLADDSERILVVSTTNRATDASSLAIGNAARDFASNALHASKLLRIGKGASLKDFKEASLESMLRGTETEYLAQIDELVVQLSKSNDSDDKAMLRKEIKELREVMRDAAKRNFLDDDKRVIVATAFRATTFLKLDEVKELIERDFTPFTTIFIDEAGLLSRAAIAALSLLASRRVVLVGDSKQLAPISRISRILPTSQMKWLAMSGLSHLEAVSQANPGVHVLQKQRRMHPDICNIVSHYQYDRFLVCAPEVSSRKYSMPEMLKDQPRALWYVLDEDGDDLPSIRAERGPGNRSWIRTATEGILDRFFAHTDFRDAKGLFISPFKAQAKQIAKFFAENDIATWSASTVHSQQGSEADIVIFDSVNAGSYSWPYDEWQRLVNVALSRAREAILVLSSRAEMSEPYLHPLVRHLAPRVFRKKGRKFEWEEAAVKGTYTPPNATAVREASSIGYQLDKRKEMRPVLSNEQQRLCNLELDGKPRLVRGVAGSGKTVVLAHWLMQTVNRLAGQQNVRIWAVFANRTLQSLISESVMAAWDQETGGKPFPWNLVSLKHIREVLADLMPEVGLGGWDFQFEYDEAAKNFLDRCDLAALQPRCDALFIDEAQDLGPNTLKLLTRLTRQTNVADTNSRSVNIFYDNAQNIYGRGTPTWSELGLGMRGRATVMKESFRSTRPITELALNVLYTLQAPDDSDDHKELFKKGLIERTERNHRQWWKVRFNQVDGPKPELRLFTSLDQEFDGIANYCCNLIQHEGIQPRDITIIYNSDYVKYRLEKHVRPALQRLGVRLFIQPANPFSLDHDCVLASTAASFKGYDSEVAIVPAIDYFRASGIGILANSLYVAMTRPRSILTLFARRSSNPEGKRIIEAVDECLNCLEEQPKVEYEISRQDDLDDLSEALGESHADWFKALRRSYKLSFEPIITTTGEELAEPLFWFKTSNKCYACFEKGKPSQRVANRLQDARIIILAPGGVVVD